MQQSQPSTETQFPPSDNGEIEQLQGLVLQGEKEEVARGEVAGGEVAGGEVAGKASKMSKAQRRRVSQQLESGCMLHLCVVAYVVPRPFMPTFHLVALKTKSDSLLFFCSPSFL